MAKTSSNKVKTPSNKLKTSLNIDENVEGALCYLLGFITGIVFLIVEKNSRFVKFHAMQSIITTVPLFIISWIFMFIPFAGWAINVLTLILWIVLMLKAYQGQMFKLPVIGDIAEKQLR